MDDEIELISDGEGVAVIGNETAVERFMAHVGLPSVPESPRLGAALAAGSAASQTGSQIAANSHRWVKLTADSAQKMHDIGLTPTKTRGISHAMLGRRGSIKGWLQLETGTGAMLTNPAMLAGVAGIMSQLAMQQQMDEIADYLEAIDKKLDHVIRSQTNQALARLDGIDLAVREAMSVREAVGRVSEVTWSKVQTSAQTIHETQGYALRQLADLADEIEQKTKISDLVESAKHVEAEARKWLLVLARCYGLHDAVAVLELDRVLDASPDELDQHRLGLASARRDRLALISAATEHLMERIDAAVEKANSKVLFNPMQSPAVVKSSNQVAAGVHELHEVLGIESGRESSEARRWKEAAEEGLDKARDIGAHGIQDAKRIGAAARAQAGSAKGKLAGKIAERRSRRGEDDA